MSNTMTMKLGNSVKMQAMQLGAMMSAGCKHSSGEYSKEAREAAFITGARIGLLHGVPLLATMLVSYPCMRGATLNMSETVLTIMLLQFLAPAAVLIYGRNMHQNTIRLNLASLILAGISNGIILSMIRGI